MQRKIETNEAPGAIGPYSQGKNALVEIEAIASQ
jgi:hypothetical protein